MTFIFAEDQDLFVPMLSLLQLSRQTGCWEERGLLSRNGFSAFSWPHTWFPPPGLPTQTLTQEDGSNWTESVAGNRIFPLETILLPLSQLWCIVWQYPLFAAFVATCVSESFFLCLKYLPLTLFHRHQFCSVYMRFHKTDFPPNSVEELWKYENWCRAKK